VFDGKYRNGQDGARALEQPRLRAIPGSVARVMLVDLIEWAACLGKMLASPIGNQRLEADALARTGGDHLLQLARRSCVIRARFARL